jgi:hypothetical protein
VRRRDFQILQKNARNQFVHQNAPVLRIVQKFDDVPIPVVRLQEMRLSAASHFAHVPDSGERHEEEME